MKYKVITYSVIIFLILSQVFTLAVAGLVTGAPNSWTVKAPWPLGGTGDTGYTSGSAVVNGTIYVISGNGNYLYNPATDNWSAFAPMPTPRRGFAVTACDNKIYVIGGEKLGFQFPLNYSPDISCSAVNEVYDPSTNTWATKASMPIGTSGVQANTVHGKIYVIGGSIVTTNPSPIPTSAPTPTPSSTPLPTPITSVEVPPTPGPTYTPPFRWVTPTVNFTEIYDPTTDSWTRGAPIPNPSSGYTSAVVDNKIYIIEDHDTQIYDPATDSWSSGAPIPVATFGTAGATTGQEAPKRIYVVGGLGKGEVGLDLPGLNQNYVYDPAANSWTTAAPMLTARYSPTVAVVDDVLFVIGGGQQLKALAANEQYTPMGYVAPTPSPSNTPSVTTSNSHTPNYSLIGAGIPLGFIVVAVAVVIVSAVTAYVLRKRMT